MKTQHAEMLKKDAEPRAGNFIHPDIFVHLWNNRGMWTHD